ncbi:hypothetical protein BN132_3256 [Cronobacter turicensis 564]|nr:hypothetical protein BN132_3256 [Cronobacter turicensis 564]
MAHHAHHLFLNHIPRFGRHHDVFIEQRFHFADGHAAFDPAFYLFNTLNVVFIELAMAAFAALGFKQAIAPLPGAQRHGVNPAPFCYLANAVKRHRIFTHDQNRHRNLSKI